MEKRICFRLPDGYKIIKRIREYDIFTACDVLRSKRQKRITRAIRMGDSAQLISHYIKCPHCGKEIPAYSHYFNKSNAALIKKSEAEISEWANIQLSMMDEPGEELSVQDFFDYSGEYICGYCGYSSMRLRNIIEIYVYYIDCRLYVKKEIKNLSELVSVKWLSGGADVSFPIYEQLVFNFENGNVYSELISNGNTICSAPVTDSETDYDKDVLVSLLTKNSVVKRTIKKCFEECSGYKMPFTLKETDFDKLVNFTRFKGFPKDFYTAIPFLRGSRVIDESFKNITEKLKTPESAMGLLEKTSIPFCKSVKRLFAKKSGLFFYLKECEYIYGLLEDVNLFCSFMGKENIFYFLSMMHYYESAVKIFLDAYSRVLDKTRFANKFSSVENIINYAVFYASLSEYVRKKEHKKWLDGVDVFDDFYIISHRVNDISTPVFVQGENFNTVVIDKYRFEHLKTKRECVIAGEKLKNCLVNWNACSNPVAVVYKGDRPVAAIEFYEDSVLQVKGYNNKSIEPYSDLYNAIKKWCDGNNIKCDPESMDGPFIR